MQTKILQQKLYLFKGGGKSITDLQGLLKSLVCNHPLVNKVFLFLNI